MKPAFEFSIEAETPKSTTKGQDILKDVDHDFYIHQYEGICHLRNDTPILSTIGTGGGKRDIFQLGYINRIRDLGQRHRGVFLSLYPTYALLNQHASLLEERFENLGPELGESNVGVLKGSKKYKLIRELGKVIDEAFVPNLGLVGTIDKWNYLHFPSRSNKYFKSEIFYQQLFTPKVFDEVHLLHPYALQTVVLNLRRERILLDIMGEKRKVPHSFYTATPPAYLEDVLRTNELISEVVAGCGKHSKLSVQVYEPPKDQYDKQLEEYLLDQSKRYDKILIILNSRRRAFTLANSLSTKLKKRKPRVEVYRVFNGWNQYREISKNNTKRLIAVATSSAEAGVSDHFDLLITESCPSQNLIQRIGRVGRYGNAEGHISIIPAPRSGEQWLEESTPLLTGKPFSSIEEFTRELQKIDQKIPGYVLPNSPSELIWALHYYLNKKLNDNTLSEFDVNARMFCGQKYDSHHNYPTLKEVEELYQKYKQLIHKIILSAMTLRTIFPNVKYENNQYSDPAYLAFRTVSSKFIHTGEKYEIPGFEKPTSPVFTLGTLPIKYAEAIWLKADKSIVVKKDRDHDYSKVWKEIKKNIMPTTKKTVEDNDIKYIKLDFGQITFHAKEFSSSDPISYSIDSEDENLIKKVGFPAFFLLFKSTGIDDGFREVVEEYLAQFPEYYYFEIYNYGKTIFAIERSFGAAMSVFKKIQEV